MSWKHVTTIWMELPTLFWRLSLKYVTIILSLSLHFPFIMSYIKRNRVPQNSLCQICFSSSLWFFYRLFPLKYCLCSLMVSMMSYLTSSTQKNVMEMMQGSGICWRDIRGIHCANEPAGLSLVCGTLSQTLLWSTIHEGKTEISLHRDYNASIYHWKENGAVSKSELQIIHWI